MLLRFYYINVGKLSKLLRFNKVIVYLTVTDIFTWGLITVINAIAGLYLSQKLDIEAVKVVGIGTAIFSIGRGLSQIPIGLITDRIKKDRDDILFLFTSTLLLGLPYLFYPLINSEYLYYFFQAISGVGAAMNLVSWRKLFASNLDLEKEGLEYASYDTVMSISVALFSVIAGLLASKGHQYFDGVIIVLGLLIISSGIWALMIFKVKDRKTV